MKTQSEIIKLQKEQERFYRRLEKAFNVTLEARRSGDLVCLSAFNKYYKNNRTDLWVPVDKCLALVKDIKSVLKKIDKKKAKKRK